MNKKRLPIACPSCGQTLTVRRFECEHCSTLVEGAFALPLLACLSPDDQLFVFSFVKASGSLKALASQYGVSYPTVRNRLDELIGRVTALEASFATEEKQ